MNLIAKALHWLAVHAEGTRKGEATLEEPAVVETVAVVTSAAQKALDSYKPQVCTAIDQVADQIAAGIDSRGIDTPRVDGTTYQALLFEKIAAPAGIPSFAKAALELAVASANVPASAIAAQGKAAVYAEATRLKALVAAASVSA